MILAGKKPARQIELLAPWLTNDEADHLVGLSDKHPDPNLEEGWPTHASLPWAQAMRINDGVIRRPIADEGRVSCRKPALLHHAALATFSGPACSMARM